MKNAEWMLKNGMGFSRLTWAHSNGRNIVYYRKNKYIEIEIYSEKSVNPENLITKWLDMEHKEPILDDVEKRYLKGVIRPFRDRVTWIEKGRNMSTGKQYIKIAITTDGVYEEVDFPYFDENEMYKGMKSSKMYTLEELGL